MSGASNQTAKVCHTVNEIMNPTLEQNAHASVHLRRYVVRMASMFAFLLGPCVMAQTLTFSEALERASERTVVVNARLELDDAQAAEGRTLADPLALRPERVQAAQRLDLARVSFEQARYDAQQEVAQAYMQILQAQAQVALAEHAREVSQQALDIARIRAERGSATELDVREAEITLEEAQNSVRTAREGLQLARTNLKGLLGLPEFDTLAPVPDPDTVTLPSLQEVLTSLEHHPQLLEVAQRHALAALNIELLDPSYAPRVQIEGAQLQLEQAERYLREVRRGLELQARRLYNQVQTTAQGWAVEETARANALTRLELERQRHAAGLIADIQLRQTELAARQAELAALQAKHAYLLALLELQAGTLTRVEGLQHVATP